MDRNNNVIYVRLVRLTLADGTRVVGLVPAEMSDAEIQRAGERIEVTFSDAMQAPGRTTLARVLRTINLAKNGVWQ